MQLKLLKGKIHRATVTDADLHYNGSLGIDADLLRAAGIIAYEHIEVYNINNGERFTTYAIPREGGSGKITVYGAAAHKVSTGDLLIICAYADMSPEQAASWRPKVVLVNNLNQMAGSDG